MGAKDQGDSLAKGLYEVILYAAFSFSGIILLIIIIHFYARCLLRHQQRRRDDHRHGLSQISAEVAAIDVSFVESPKSGLHPLTVASLPKLLYKQTDQFGQGKVTECSVCLASILEDAIIRVLPNCNHMFHVDCVDMWFSSNTTCPICRTVSEPRVQPGHAPLATKLVQPTAPPLEDGAPQPQEVSELAKVDSSGLRE